MIECGYYGEDAFVVSNPSDAAAIWSDGFFGAFTPDSYICLTPYEALYLLDKRRISVRTISSSSSQAISLDKLYKIFESKIARFASLWQVYLRLREAGWIVRSGLNYGTDFVLYRTSPDEEHAEYAVLVLASGIPEDSQISWRRVLGINRSCAGARKRLLIATVNAEQNLSIIKVERWLAEADRF